MSDPCCRRLAGFYISFWNKQIGSDDSVFGDQKALLDGYPRKSNDRLSPLFTILSGEKRPLWGGGRRTEKDSRVLVGCTHQRVRVYLSRHQRETDLLSRRRSRSVPFGARARSCGSGGLSLKAGVRDRAMNQREGGRQRSRAAALAIERLRHVVAIGYRITHWFANARQLNPLWGRADVRALLMNQRFPANPFVTKN
jgi:hypothetical protein